MQNVTHEQGVAVVTLPENGNWFDEGVVLRLEEVLREQALSIDRPFIVIDMRWVDNFGSKFLGALYATHKQLRGRGGRLAVCDVASPFCDEILTIVRADQVFDICESRQAAIDGLLRGIPAASACSSKRHAAL
ncbi:MAG: STAS domain-containing protein [Pirellulales bacterium]